MPGDLENKQKPLLPLFLDLQDRTVAIFGGGKVGERKARLFSPYARVRVISNDFVPGLEEMAEKGLLQLVRADLLKGFEGFLERVFIAIPATSDLQLNRAIELKAQEMGILVNKVDGVGDVVVPSIMRKDPIAIAISTKSPALSKHLRLRLENDLVGNYQEMAQLLGQLRTELKRSIPEQKERAKIIWEILQDEEIWKLLDISYEKAYMKARKHAIQDERDSLDAGDPPQGLDR